MDELMELLRLLETLPAAWSALVQTTREVVYGLLPPELAANEWLLWGAVVIAALFAIVMIAGGLGGGE